MTDDITKEWRASQGQKSKARNLRIFALVAWVIAIGTEIAGVVLLFKDKFNDGNLVLLLALLGVIAVFAITGSLLWKAANKHDPASKEDGFRFFVQNQLGAIITLVAFVPLVVLIFLDKDMDPKNKKIAGGVGAALAVIATLIGVSYNPPSTEQYTEDMNKCAAQMQEHTSPDGKVDASKLTACNEQVIDQAADIARDTAAVENAKGDAANVDPEDLDTVYWIDDNGNEHVFHLCAEAGRLEGKKVDSGSVTEAYAEKATRITQEIPREQRECGFTAAE